MPQLQRQNTQNVPEMLLLQPDLVGSKTEPKSNMETELRRGWRDGEEAAARFVTTVTLLLLKVFSASHTQTLAANVEENHHRLKAWSFLRRGFFRQRRRRRYPLNLRFPVQGSDGSVISPRFARNAFPS